MRPRHASFQLLKHVAAGERVVITRAGQRAADPVPHRAASMVFGGLRGEVSSDDGSFAGVDPDIQRPFYGDDVAAP